MKPLMTSHKLFGIRIDDLSETELSRTLSGYLASQKGHSIVTPNPEIILRARKDHDLRELLGRSDLSLPDGVGLRFAIAALGQERLRYRHTGVDVFLTVMKLCAETNRSVLLVGGKPGTAERSAAVLNKAFPGLRVEGFDPGAIEGRAGHLRMLPDIETKIIETAPDVLVVALGAGKQEEFVMRSLEFAPSIRIGIGVGGAFEMVSGSLPRAPEKWRQLGLEWLWRLRLEPRRAGRILRASVVFPIVVACATIREGRFISACKLVFPEVIRQLKGL